MGSDEDRKKLNDDLVDFMGRRTGADNSRYVTRLRSYVDMQHKRHRAVAARRFYSSKRESSASRKKNEGDMKDKTMENTDQLDDDEDGVRKRYSGDAHSRSEGPCDRCGRRRRRRRRSRCGRRRRRRRRRSCKRRRRRRRRRSCSRRRRRRSCRRRRRRRRRRRC